MPLNVPIIMRHFSASLHADKRKRNTGMQLFDVALNVSWSQTLGAKETSFSERWKLIAPNIFLATLQKK